jgi:hypothetical protein
VKYDDAAWHYGGDFPSDLTPEAGATHIGMFVAWMLLNGFAGDIHADEPEQMILLQRREVTPGEWFIRNCDEKFTDEDLSAEGNQFAGVYYETSYLADYQKLFPNVYNTQDSWTNFDELAPIISKRVAAWQRNRRPWWKRLF